MAEEKSFSIFGQDVVFGLPGDSVPWGVVLDRKSDPSSEVKEYPSQDGNTGTVVVYNKKEKYSIEVLRATSEPGGIAADLPMPEQGDWVTYMSKRMMVTKASVSGKIDDAEKISIELTYWPRVSDQAL